MKTSVLFVCVHNAGRSQMAAAMLENFAEGLVEVRSAGSMPAEQINPSALAAMQVIGIDISQSQPKLLTDQAVLASDYVITMGCGDSCPIYPGKKYLDWQIADPAGKSLAEVEVIRDEIEKHVRELLLEIMC
jgi:arsenate reductase